MSDWDKLSNYISDYLEGNLDNSSRKEFEQEIEKNSDLRNLTGKVSNLSRLLKGLPEHKCSDDFSVKLRKKIHQSSAKIAKPVSSFKKYSFAFSFVIVAVVAIFAIGTFMESEDPAVNLPESSNIPSVQPDPVNQNTMQPTSNVQADNKQVDIKTIYENPVAADSLHNKAIEKEKDDKIKYVDETKK